MSSFVRVIVPRGCEPLAAGATGAEQGGDGPARCVPQSTKRRDDTSMQHIWQDCSRLLETELTPQQFSAWIKPLKALDFDESTATLTIGAPNRLKLDAIRSQFSDRIAQAASRVAQRPVAIVFAVDGASALAAAMRFPSSDSEDTGVAPIDTVPGHSEQFERSRLNP